MTLFSAPQIDALPGFVRLQHAELPADFASVSTDSRTLPAGALFVPLKGERFDGHRFLHEAFARGAGGAVVHEKPSADFGKPVWKVADTLHALGDLAHAHRNRFAIPLCGLTGTAGKTTTKEILRAMFAKRSLLVNEGNLNNLIGVPLTLFGLRPEHAFAVIEMGMNHFGEIERLAQIARPTVGLITNVGPGHLEGVGDLEGVLRAKTELAREMDPDQTLVLNADDALLRRWGHGAQRKITWFGLQVGADVTAHDVADRGLDGSEFTFKAQGQARRVKLRLPGEHNIRNALGAAAAALAMGLPFDEVAAGIEAVAPFRMRGETLAGPNGSTLLSDCYNANPSSMKESLRVLAGARSRGRIGAVLGDMLELGAHAEPYHRELGEFLAAVAPDRVWVVGTFAPLVAGSAGKPTVTVQNDRLALADEVRAWLREGDTLLVKGSRGMKLEALVETLTGARTEH